MTVVALSNAVVVGVTSAWYFAALAAAVWPLQDGPYVGPSLAVAHANSTRDKRLKMASLVQFPRRNPPNHVHCPSNGLYRKIQRV